MQDTNNQPLEMGHQPKPIIYLGVGLITVGVYIALYVAVQLLALYKGLDTNPFVAHLLQQLSGTALLSDGPHHFVLEPGGARLVALLSFVLLCWVGIAIAFALIRSGSYLISPQFRMQLATLKLKLEQIRRDLGRNLASGNSKE